MQKAVRLIGCAQTMFMFSCVTLVEQPNGWDEGLRQA
jgi:hypothetical protein